LLHTQNCTTWYPRHAEVTSQGLRFTAKVFAPFYSDKQDYGGTKIEILEKNRRSERKIKESGGFRQELQPSRYVGVANTTQHVAVWATKSTF
jgi:hypothetical protein